MWFTLASNKRKDVPNMKEALQVLTEAQSVLRSRGSLNDVRLGFDPSDDGSIHELDRRHKQRTKRKVTSICKGKVRYKDREQAKAALITIRYTAGISSSEEAQSKHLPIREYPCHLGCSGWHLTSHAENPSLTHLELAA